MLWMKKLRPVYFCPEWRDSKWQNQDLIWSLTANLVFLINSVVSLLCPFPEFLLMDTVMLKVLLLLRIDPLKKFSNWGFPSDFNPNKGVEDKLVAQTVKNLPTMQETWVWSLEKEMATHSSILDWGIPWTEEPGGLLCMWLQRVGPNWAGNTFHFGKLSRGHRTGKGQLSFHSQRRAMPKNIQTTVQLCSFQS